MLHVDKPYNYGVFARVVMYIYVKHILSIQYSESLLSI